MRSALAQIRGNDFESGLAHAEAGRHVEAINCFERALARRPDDRQVLFALAKTASALGMSAAAETFYRKVLASEPDCVEVLVNLSNLLRVRGEASTAIAMLGSALARSPNAPELWLTLGSAHLEIGDRETAESLYRQALARRPDYAAAMVNLADVFAGQGRNEEAFALYDKAISRDPGLAQARLNRAILHLLTGNLKPGWRDYESRLKLQGKVPVADHGLKRWDGASLKRKRLLVTAEQGVGDQLMFASLVPDLECRARSEGASLILECEPRLVSLYARSFPRVTVRASVLENRNGVTTARYDWLKSAGGAGVAIELGSLAKHLRGSLECFSDPHAYLIPDEDERTRWRMRFSQLGPGPYIGICWRSGKTGGARNLQYAPIEAWGLFLRNIPGTIISVQYDGHDQEVAALRALSGRPIHIPENVDQKNELDRACAILAATDGVVSAPTAVSWLSAGAGVPTFKVLYDTSWTSFGQAHEPMAPSCHCVMPATAGDWESAFSRAACHVRALAVSRG